MKMLILKFSTLFTNFLKSPSVILDKISKRLFDNRTLLSITELNVWLEENKSDLEAFCKGINEELWIESYLESNIIKKASNEKLDKIPFELGGGGAYPFLYFLIRLLKPSVVVETGVAAGYSSFSILKALNKNDYGRLYSSDFPYFRIPNPENYIGILVPEDLKLRWDLFIKGDKNNFIEIKKLVSKIDILHYDSDKTYTGRELPLKYFRNELNSSSILIFDDIQDNSHFHDLVKVLDRSKWRIFPFENKWFGFIGSI
jgi:hypothetical protein